MPTNEKLVAYLEGAAPDARGRLLRDQWRWDDATLEETHDFIQWWFPLPERSLFNPWAPTPDEAALDALPPRARAAIVRSAERFCAFLDRTGYWLDRYDHNHKRVSRMLLCLTLVGEGELARRIHAERLERVREHRARTGRGGPDEETLAYWEAALEGRSSPG